MFNFLIDSIFVVFDSCVFQQRVSIPIGTNCAPILADLFLYLYETDLIQGSLQRKEKKLDQSFTNSFCCIDNVLSLSNVWFEDFLDHIFPNELEIKDTSNTLKSTSYLYLENNYEDQFRSKLYDKRDNCNFPIVNFPFM